MGVQSELYAIFEDFEFSQNGTYTEFSERLVSLILEGAYTRDITVYLLSFHGFSDGRDADHVDLSPGIVGHVPEPMVELNQFSELLGALRIRGNLLTSSRNHPYGSTVDSRIRG